MAFIGKEAGTVFAPGYFLVANELCDRETRQAEKTKGATVGDRKVVKMGTIYPADTAAAIGIVYEDVDVTEGDAPCSVVTKGTVYTNRLPAAPSEAAKTALEKLGFKFVTESEVTRPY